jgi:hypothetical protein
MMNMRKLIGLAFTYVDGGSSIDEYLTAGRIGKQMIVRELGCPVWVAHRILEMVAGRESWFPHWTRMHLHGTLPTNAVDEFEKYLSKLPIRYTTEDYGYGGTTFKAII